MTAYLELEEAPPDFEVSIPPEGIEIPPDGLLAGITPECHVMISADVEARRWRGLGGRRTLRIIRTEGRWCLDHLGHAGTIHLNGAPLRGTDGGAILANGDRIEPALGLVLRFHGTSSEEELRAYEAVRAALPDRVSLLHLLRQGSPSEAEVAMERMVSIWERLERRLRLFEILDWRMSAEDAEVEADRRLQLGPRAVLETEDGESIWMFDEPRRIGRAEENEIPLRSMVVSRRHARLDWQGDQLLLEDVGSSSGIYLDGQKITRHALRVGDVFRIGQVMVRVVSIRSP